MFIVAQRNSPHAWQTDRESFVILDITSPKGRQKKQKVPKYRKISRKEKLNKSEVNYVWVKALQNNDNYKYVLILMYPVTESCSFFQLNHILQIVLFFWVFQINCWRLAWERDSLKTKESDGYYKQNKQKRSLICAGLPLRRQFNSHLITEHHSYVLLTSREGYTCDGFTNKQTKRDKLILRLRPKLDNSRPYPKLNFARVRNHNRRVVSLF